MDPTPTAPPINPASPPPPPPVLPSSSPKHKWTTTKIVAATFGIAVLLVGITVGVYLARQPQRTNIAAAPCAPNGITEKYCNSAVSPEQTACHTCVNNQWVEGADCSNLSCNACGPDLFSSVDNITCSAGGGNPPPGGTCDGISCTAGSGQFIRHFVCNSPLISDSEGPKCQPSTHGSGVIFDSGPYNPDNPLLSSSYQGQPCTSEQIDILQIDGTYVTHIARDNDFSNCTAPTPTPAPLGRIQGRRYDGCPADINTTVTVVGTNSYVLNNNWIPSNTPTNLYTTGNILGLGSVHTVTFTPPVGYTAQYSYCQNAINHPTCSLTGGWTNGNSVSVTVPTTPTQTLGQNDYFVDLYWRCQAIPTATPTLAPTVTGTPPPSPTPLPTLVPTATPTPIPGTAQCLMAQVVAIGRDNASISAPTLAKIQLGDQVTFRGFATAVNTSVSAIRFTVTRDGAALPPVDVTATLVGSSYQADYQITIDQATNYTIVTEPIYP